MSKKFFVLLALFLLVSVVFVTIRITYYEDSPTQFPLLQSKPTATPENTLSLSPNPLTVVSGQRATVDVVLETNNTSPNLVQFEIEYDPTALGDVKVVPGDFFENPTILLNIVNPRTGRISYAIEPPAATASKRTGKVAIITFTPLSSAKRATTLSFLPKTAIREHGEQNTLKVGYGTQVIINPLRMQQSSPSAEVPQY